jgi:hypothetical protein
MPYPLDDEGRVPFIRRCMRDAEARETFPDDDQRAAFCYAQWDEGQGYGDKKKRKRRSRKMALEPKAEERHGSFLTRCMADVDMAEEYESDGEREEACELIWSEAEAPKAEGEGEDVPEEYSAKAQAEDDDPEAPPKGEGEARDKWIADCLVSPDVVAEIPDDEKRLSHCEEQWAAEYGDGEDLEEEQAFRVVQGVVPYKATPAMAEDAGWDGDAARKSLEGWASGGGDLDLDNSGQRSKYEQGFTFVHDDGTTLANYSLPHHEVVGGSLKVNRHGVSAAIAAINGGRGGVDMSESERRGAYDHLAKHLKAMDLDPPEFKQSAIRILTGEQALAAASDAERLPTGYLQHWSDQTVVQSTQPTKMSADFIVLTRQREPNRHGNIVQIADGENGRGLMLDHYRTNPVVMFDHGLNTTLPIGTSEGPDGKLSVRLTKNRATARAYFSQSLPEAATIYALIDEGILRTASVQFLPKRARKLSIKQRQDFGDDEVSLVDGIGLDYTESDLLEWSVVSIPADPGAVRRCLDRGHVNGEVITMSLMPVMKQMGGPVPVWSPGWSPQSQHVISVDEDETSVTVKYERHREDEEEQGTDIDTEAPIQTIDYEAVAAALQDEWKQRQKVAGATKAVAEALKPVTEAMDKLEAKLSRLTG